MLTIKEFAAREGRSVQRIHQLIQQERIKGAVFKWNRWLIPKSAKLPPSLK